MSPRVSVLLQRRLRQHFHNCCGYCQTQESLIPITFEIEHIIPRAAAGETVFENLCLACPHCNRHKASRQSFRDPITQEVVRLFHPHQQVWSEHFMWNEDFSLVLGQTPTARATIEALEINRLPLVRLRKLWRKFGEHPPI